MIDCYCERECEFFEDRSTNYIIDGYCKKYSQPVALDFCDWWIKCDKCIDEQKMTEEEKQ